MNLQIKTVSGTSLSNAVILTAIYVLINDLCFQIFGNIVEYSSQWLTLNSYLLFGCLFFSPSGFPILFSCLCPRRICIFLHGCRLWNTRLTWHCLFSSHSRTLWRWSTNDRRHKRVPFATLTASDLSPEPLFLMNYDPPIGEFAGTKSSFDHCKYPNPFNWFVNWLIPCQ